MDGEQLELFKTDNSLRMLLTKQREFGCQFTDFGNLTEVEMQVRLLDFISCTIEELVEMRIEFPYRKHWSSKRLDMPDWSKVKEELIDVLHFVLTMFLILGMDENEICGLYLLKNRVNIIRQEEGTK